MGSVNLWAHGAVAAAIVFGSACTSDSDSETSAGDGGSMNSTTGADMSGTSSGTTGGNANTSGGTTGGGTTAGTTGGGTNTTGGTTGGSTTGGTTGGSTTGGTTGGTGGSTTGGNMTCSSSAESACDFIVTVATKDNTHPWYGMGNASGYVIGGVQGKALSLKRGTAYTFLLKQACAHPFYISTSDVGSGAGNVTSGVSITGASACNGAVMTFTPSAGTANTVYYQCENHNKMGGTITVSN